MKVFEDLIEELKEENLIEETVIETGQLKLKGQPQDDIYAQPFKSAAPQSEIIENSQKEEDHMAPMPDTLQEELPVQLQLPDNENDFYRRRAMEEVASLQMVERIFSAVEREQAKISPKPYNDIAVSKALHDFLQVSKDPNNPESAAAEFKLMQETESWYSALAHRDQHILPVHLRRYCETTKPALSSQALIALARFYRNSPFSESIRSKFDLIVTRLFGREVENDERELAFEFDELVQHLSELYADWSSIPLYSTDDETELTIIALKFEDFISEAAAATEFEDLVKTDFFNRLRAFKESTGENFYAPLITATVVNCNIKVGNRYVELLSEEKKKNNGAKLEDKYNYLLDHTISEATSKTLQLVQLLKEKGAEPEAEPVVKERKVEDLAPKAEEAKAAPVKKKSKVFEIGSFKANKWLVAVTVITILANAILYTWVEYSTPKASTSEVKTFETEGYYFREYLKVAKVTNETLIGITNDSWNDLNEDKKKEVLNNMLSIGKTNGFQTVKLMSNEGRTVGYLSAQNITEDNSKNTN